MVSATNKELLAKIYLTQKEAMKMLRSKGLTKRASEKVVKDWKKYTEIKLSTINKRLPDNRKFPTDTLVEMLKKYYGITRKDMEKEN